MNRILEVDPVLGYAVIEPGVTQGQLAGYLREQGHKLWLDVTGAGPEASIVGNTLERGFGHTPYGDHLAHSCGMEVVLANGSVMNTGFGAYENAKAARVFPWGLGPWVDGLFTQSNFGIVTRMGVWLMPEPERCLAFALATPDPEALPALVEALRPLRLADVVRSSVHIANDLRVLSARTAFPRDLAPKAASLPRAIRERLRAEAGVGAWNLLGGLYGSRAAVQAARKDVRRALKHFGRLVFFDDRKLRIAESAARLLGRFGFSTRWQRALPFVRSGYDLLRGNPTSQHLQGAAWRSPNGVHGSEIDPQRCGLIWLSPVLPATGSHCIQLRELAEPIFQHFNFDLLITVTSITPRAVCAVMSICYDKQSVGERQRAVECYHELLETLARHGYLPYRTGIQSMPKLAAGAQTYWELVGRLKAAIDPDSILAPGRHPCGAHNG